MTKKDANTALLKAAAEGNLEALKAAITAGADIHNAKDSMYDWNVLDVASCNDEEENNRAVIKYLIDAGADSSGAVGCAVQKDRMENAKFLIECGADVNGCDGWALRTSFEDIFPDEEKTLTKVQYLLSVGANPNLRAATKPYTALDCAAKSGLVSVVKLLVEAGAVADENSLEAAADAFQYNAEVVKLLLEAGAPITADALRETVQGGELERLQFLISHGADVAAADEKMGLVAMAFRKKECTPELVQALLDAGANVNYHDKMDAYNPMLRFAVECCVANLAHMKKYGKAEQVEEYHQRAMGILECLIKAGVDVNAVGGRYGVTALIEAAEAGDPAMVKLFLDAGADVTILSKDGKKAGPKASCPQPQKKEIQDMLKEARAAAKAAAKAAK